MQINIDKKTGSFLGVIAILVVTLGVVLYQNSDGTSSQDVASMMETQDKLYKMGGDNSNSEFAMNSDEIMFAQQMIPHHEQAVTMAEYALTNSKNQEVLDLAKQIKEAQAPEIAQMKSWLDGAGANYMIDHNMGMSGMLSDSDLAALEAATGRDFDMLFLQGMIAHHEGAIVMATEIENSSNKEIKSLHDNIVKSQSAEISQMKALLTTL